jgi:hypothetical protein
MVPTNIHFGGGLGLVSGTRRSCSDPLLVLSEQSLNHRQSHVGEFSNFLLRNATLMHGYHALLRSFDHSLPHTNLRATVDESQIIQAKRYLQKVDNSGNRLSLIACWLKKGARYGCNEFGRQTEPIFSRGNIVNLNANSSKIWCTHSHQQS